jgi:hypothetical protein
MSTPFERLSTQQKIMVNDLIINGFRDNPAQLERYSQAMRAERGVDAASDRFQSMLDEQRNQMAVDVQQGNLRLPNFRDTPFGRNSIPDGEDLARGRGVLRKLRDYMANNSQRTRFDFSQQNMSDALVHLKRGHGYEAEGINPLPQRANAASPQPPAGLTPETLDLCRSLGHQAQAAHMAGDREGANALTMEASRANCPTPSGRGR